MMIRHVLFASAFALAAPAAAQEMEAPPADPPERTEAPSAAQIGQFVQAEFPTRDRDGDGALNQAEFSAWLGELMARAPGQTQPPSPEDQQARAATAFARADTDRNQSVSQDEMAAFLSRTR